MGGGCRGCDTAAGGGRGDGGSWLWRGSGWGLMCIAGSVEPTIKRVCGACCNVKWG